MEIKQAIEILHPDTSLSTLAEIEYYAGLNGYEAKIKACDEACGIVCNEIKRLQKENAELQSQRSKVVELLKLAHEDIYRQCSNCAHWVDGDGFFPKICEVEGCLNLYNPDRWQWQHASAMRGLGIEV